MKILYKCACMPAEGEIEVPFRRDGEDIVDWMRGCVEPSIYLDHRKRSPLCCAPTMEYAKIPVSEAADGIGEKPKLQ